MAVESGRQSAAVDNSHNLQTKKNHHTVSKSAQDKEKKSNDVTAETSHATNLTIDADCLIGQVPDESVRIMQQIVRKLDRQFVWRDRLLILTSDGLFVVEKSEDAVMTPQVKDHVPLDEIEKTACVALKDEIPEVAKTTSFRTEVARSEQKLDASEYEKQWLQMATDGMQAHVLSVKTYGEGVLAGRVLQFCLDTDDDVNLWVEQVSQAVKQIHKKTQSQTTLAKRTQDFAYTIYHSNGMQTCVAVLIFLNFVANVAQAEMQPEEASDIDTLFSVLDVVFNVIFAAELVINLVAHWFLAFFSDGWCLLDLVVVTVSLISMVAGSVPGVSTLRLMRAFRVLRLFGRFASLRQIINAVAAAFVPVCNAFLILFLVMSIYAILAVSFYSAHDPERFGSFSRALFAMFQVCTGDGWSTPARRLFAIMEPDSKGAVSPSVAIFFASFHIIVSWTLLQVVVAVLLDNFSAASNAEKVRTVIDAAQKSHKDELSTDVLVLDPLLAGRCMYICIHMYKYVYTYIYIYIYIYVYKYT